MSRNRNFVSIGSFSVAYFYMYHAHMLYLLGDNRVGGPVSSHDICVNHLYLTRIISLGDAGWTHNGRA